MQIDLMGQKLTRFFVCFVLSLGFILIAPSARSEDSKYIAPPKGAIPYVAPPKGATLVTKPGPVETWECIDFYEVNWANILVTASIEVGRQEGTIHVAGVEYHTKFTTAGFNRRWDFGPAGKDGTYPYAFVVAPNGQAGYYDFSMHPKSASPSMHLKCRKPIE